MGVLKKMINIRRILSITIYLGSIVLANWLVIRYGFVPVGFGLMAPAGTFLAGIAFVARDAVQDTIGRTGALAVLIAGAILSWFIASPALALASAVAFGLSELVDMIIYTPLRKRGYLRAAMASNVIGSIVDSVTFLWLAGFALSVVAVGGQWIGKLWITIVTLVLVLAWRAGRRMATDST